jgi:hypothetical protein
VYPERPYAPWRDDYGWWGLAFARAVKYGDHLDLDGPRIDACRHAAQACWQILVSSAEENEKYGNAKPNTPQNEYKRKIIGSDYCVWNNSSAKEYDSTKSEVPNTVTNTGFLALGIALYEVEPEEKLKNLYKDAVKKSLTYFRNVLFNYPDIKDVQQRVGPNNLLINDYGLIRETPNLNAHKAWCYDRGRAWSADQGMMLYCLRKAMNLFAVMDGSFVPIIDALQGAILPGYDRKDSDGDKMGQKHTKLPFRRGEGAQVRQR